jgi:hypothetical protein
VKWTRSKPAGYDPPLSRINALAKALGVPVTELLK